MAQRSLGCLVLMLLLTANRSPETVVEFIGSSPLTSVNIDGRQTTVEVASDGPNSPIVNASVAESLGKKGSLVRGKHLVGHTVVFAESNMAVIDYGHGRPSKQRLFWFERNWSSIAEGRIGPAALPQDVIIFRLAQTQPGEHIYTFPLSVRGIAVLRSETEVSNQAIPVAFTLNRSETVLTAATGALLAKAYDGRMAGAPRNIAVEMGFSRPVRTMEFNSPVALNALTLRNIVVRTQDTGPTTGIPDKDQDLSEIIVSANSKIKPHYGIFIGYDSISNCSTLTFDKVRMEIRLSCH